MVLADENNTDLAFDTDVLTKCATSYGEIAGQLRTLATDLDNCLLDLEQSGWTTPAGSAFREMVTTDWSENIDKYADLLEMLQTILNQSATSYDGLVKEHIEVIKP